jgi:hypothetical protein
MPKGTFKELILVMNSIAVTTGGTREKFEKFGGPKVIYQVQGAYIKIEKKVSLHHVERWSDRESNQIIVRLKWGMNEWAMNGNSDENRFFATSFTPEPICYKLLTRSKTMFSRINRFGHFQFNAQLNSSAMTVAV